MKVAKVLGSVWATRKDDNLQGRTLLVTQPIHPLTQKAEETPLVAVDFIGAGVGDRVLLAEGYAAFQAANGADATIVAILDDQIN